MCTLNMVSIFYMHQIHRHSLERVENLMVMVVPEEVGLLRGLEGSAQCTVCVWIFIFTRAPCTHSYMYTQLPMRNPYIYNVTTDIVYSYTHIHSKHRYLYNVTTDGVTKTTVEH